MRNTPLTGLGVRIKEDKAYRINPTVVLYLWTFVILSFKNLGIGVNMEVPTSFQSSFWMTSSILLSGAMNMSVK